MQEKDEKEAGVTTGGIHDEKKEDTRWLSASDLILLNLSRHYAMEDYKMYALPNDAETPNFFQIFLAYVVVVIPISYMEVVLGQYTSTGIFHIHNLMPIAEGMSYTYALQAFATTTLMVMLMGQFLTFAYLSFITLINAAEMHWLTCPQDLTNICFSSLVECTGDLPCINETRHLSSYVYWVKAYMKEPVMSPKDASFGIAPLYRLSTLAAAWIIVWACISLKFEAMRLLIKRLYIVVLIHKVIQFVVISIVISLMQYMPIMIQLDIPTFVTFKAWRNAILKVTMGSGVGDFTYILLGMKSPPTRKTGSFMWFCGFASCVLTMFDHVIISGSIYALCEIAKLPRRERYLLFRPVNIQHEFGVIPEILAFSRFSAILNGLYFCQRFLVLFFKILLMISFLLLSLFLRYPKLQAYRKYLIAGFCIFGCLFSMILDSKEMYVYRYDLYNNVLKFTQQLNVAVLAIIVLYVYSVPKLCDDVHFMSSSEPAQFWFIVWWLSPIAFMLGAAWYIFEPTNELFTYRMVTFGLFYVPYIIFLMITFVEKIRQKQLLTLLRATDEWAPLDPVQRLIRKTFNPRFDSKRKIQSNKCLHKCLIEAKSPESDEEEEDNLLIMLEVT